MSDNRPRMPEPDLSRFEENIHKFPQDELAKYHGRYVAFSPDATRIVASGDSWEDLFKQLDAAGIHFSQVVGSYVAPPDMVFLGSAGLLAAD